MEKAAKKRLFEELYQLDEDFDTEDSSKAASILGRSEILSTTKLSEERAPREASPRPEQSLRSTIPSVLPKADRSSPNLTGPLRTTSSPDNPSLTQRAPIALDKSKSVKGSIAAAKPGIMEYPGRKRKRDKPVVMKPEAQQLFKGLSFFFVPNNDISGARKFRIRKAMEFGAVWVRQWGEHITHVIVDHDVNYEVCLQHLGISAFPPGIALVTENYPSDCLIHRYVVNPHIEYYHIDGQPAAQHEREFQTSQVSAVSSDKSLQVKSTKENVLRKQSPSRTESSKQNASGPSATRGEPDSPNNHQDDIPPGSSDQARTALDEAIDEAKGLQDLPLDLDEDETPSDEVESCEEDGESSEDERRPKSKVKKGSFDKSWQEGFSCMSKNDGISKSGNPNERTIEILQRMADYYEREQDHWRLTAYRRAIGALKKQKRKISTAKEAFAIPFIGQRLADKIEEIVYTNKLRRLENTSLDINDEALHLFMKIYGVGLKQASKWIDQGFRTIADLESKATLTKNQKVGIEHLEDFQTRIPRKEMDQHDEFVREVCGKIDSTIQFTIGGSYRRGAADSGDVDFIITKPDCPIETLRTIILETVIPRLFEQGYLKVGLATTSKDDGSKWHGAAALPGHSVWRRIDFLLVPYEELGTALIYFTGNDIFNRSIRLLASKKGMRLNQRGLWKDVIRGPNRALITQGTLVESRDERRIFEILGVPWRPPSHRIC